MSLLHFFGTSGISTWVCFTAITHVHCEPKRVIRLPVLLNSRKLFYRMSSYKTELCTASSNLVCYFNLEFIWCWNNYTVSVRRAVSIHVGRSSRVALAILKWYCVNGWDCFYKRGSCTRRSRHAFWNRSIINILWKYIFIACLVPFFFFFFSCEAEQYGKRMIKIG